MPPRRGEEEEGWKTWDELGSRRETKCKWMDKDFVHIPFYEEFTDRSHQTIPFIYLFGLTVPDRFIGGNLASARLREDYGFIGVALESEEKKLNFDVCSSNAVLNPPPGLSPLTLWVAVTTGLESMQSIERFLQRVPETLPARYVQLCAFRVDRVPEWVGRNLKENRIRADHSIIVIFIFSEASEDAQSKDVIKRMGRGVVLFPDPARPLRLSDSLMVLRPDFLKLEAIEEKRSIPGDEKEPEARMPWADMNEELEVWAEGKLLPDMSATEDQKQTADRLKGMVMLNTARRSGTSVMAVASPALPEPNKGPGPKREQLKAQRQERQQAERAARQQQEAGGSPLGVGYPQIPPWMAAPQGQWPMMNPMMAHAAAAAAVAQQAAAYQMFAAQAANAPWLLPAAAVGGWPMGMPAFPPTGDFSPQDRRRGDKAGKGRQGFENPPWSGTRPTTGSPMAGRDGGTPGYSPEGLGGASGSNFAGASSGAWLEVRPLLWLSGAELAELQGRPRKSADEKPKGIDVLGRKQQIVSGAYSRASEEDATQIRERVLQNCMELSKDESGCLLVKHLLSKLQAPASWEELRFGGEQDMEAKEMKPGLDVYTTGTAMDSVSMLVVGLAVPENLSGHTVRDLRLREKYGFSAVAIESPGGLDELDVRMIRPLLQGSRLWVGFEQSTSTAQALQSVESFLGAKPQRLSIRYLTLSTFGVDKHPEWCGKTLVESRIRNNYDVSILGIIPGRGEGGRVVNVNDIVCFPNPDNILRQGDRLLVLCPDLKRLEVSQTSSGSSSYTGFLESLASELGRQGKVVELAKDKNGCHVIQEALKALAPRLKMVLVRSLMSDATGLLEQVIKSQHGIHVVKECLFQAFYGGFESGQEASEVAETLLLCLEREAGILGSGPGQKRALPANFLGASGALLDKKRFSYRLVLWIIEYFANVNCERIQGLFDALADNTDRLIEDNNGSIVLSSVLEFGETQRERIFEVVLSRMDVEPIPKHWYPSFLIDKMIVDRKILNSIRDGKARILDSLYRNGNLQRIQAHRSGAYTSRRVYSVLCEGDEESRGRLARLCPKLPSEEERQKKGPDARRADFSFNDSLLGRVEPAGRPS
mmetsp:Transcript_14404/g.50600  ORF Transcript_14404/g.50600 Transcript_14404/m.50600 type:complete len:1102 (-) Transcript_14404:56-3361(-)